MATCLLVGCGTRVEKYGYVDQSDKSITVAPGSVVVGPIKSALRKNGWKVYAYSSVTHREAGNSTTSEVSGRSRYLLELEAQFFDYAFPTLEKMFHYDLGLVDLRSQEEVFSINGSGTEREIVKVMLEQLK